MTRALFSSFLALCLLAACGEERRPSNDDDDAEHTIETTVTTSGPGSGGASSATSSQSSGGTGGGAGGAGGSDAGIVPGDLVITEVMNNPSAVADDSGEWFEVYNASGHAIDLQGMVIQHQADPSFAEAIAAPLVVGPGEYAILGREADPSLNGGVSVDYVYGFDVYLHNAADYLAIVAGDDVIDATSWDELSGLDPDGASRSLDPAFNGAATNDDDAHFCEASTIMASGDRGTPGAPNDGC